MRIPFNVKYRPQIESGEYKVETKGGESVHILSFEALGPYPICYQVGNGMDIDFPPRPDVYFAHNNGECSYSPNSLFIVTPEEELTEFEKCLADLVSFSIRAGLPNDGDYEAVLTSESIRFAKMYSEKLLTIAREQFIKDGYVIEKKAFHDAVKKVNPKVMKEVSESIDKTERTEFERELVNFFNEGNAILPDKDGVYNKRDCEEFLHKGANKLLATAEKELSAKYKISSDLNGFAYGKGYEDGKKEALKDLPRWKKIGQGNNYSSEAEFCINGRYLEMNDTLNDVYEISLKNLEKLLKEDEE